MSIAKIFGVYFKNWVCLKNLSVLKIYFELAEGLGTSYIWLTSCELSTNNLAVVSLICGGASDPIRISTRLGNKNANFDRIEKQLLKSRYLRFMPCFCSQRRYFSWVTKIGFEDEFDVTWLRSVKVLDSVKELTYLVLPKIITVFPGVIIVAAELRTRNLS